MVNKVNSLSWDPSFREWSVNWRNHCKDSTLCYDSTLWIFITSFILFVAATIEIFHSLKRMSCPSLKAKRGRSSSFWLIGEILGCICLIGLDLTRVVINFLHRELQPKDLSLPEIVGFCLRAVNFIIIIVLIGLDQTKHIRIYRTRSVFWMVSLCFSCLACDSIIRKQETYQFEDWLELSRVGLLIAVVLWYFSVPKYSPENKHPEANASVVSKLFYLWTIPLFKLGYSENLQTSDLWELDPKYLASNLHGRFKTNWDAKQNSEVKRKQLVKHNYGVLCVIMKTFWVEVFWGGFYKFVTSVFPFTTPLLLKSLIALILRPKTSLNDSWEETYLVVLLFATLLIYTVMNQVYYHEVFSLGIKVGAALMCAVHRKVLCLSNIAKKELSTTAGDIFNLMTIDVNNIMEFLPFLHLFWAIPFQIGVAFIFLWNILDAPSAFAGVSVMILVIPINASVSKIARNLQQKQMKYKDKRVKVMAEIISGIKSIKLYAWEAFFDKNVRSIRNEEIRELNKAALLQSITCSLCSSSLIVASAASFITYVLVDGKNVLTPEKAFVTFTVLNVLQYPMQFFHQQMSKLITACVSLKRINRLMTAEEITKESTNSSPAEGLCPVEFKNSSIAWEKEKYCLNHIDITIKDGELVAIVGVIGSGKSTLLSALLGETINKGTLKKPGVLAYVPQQAWIQNLSLKDNIIFGNKYDEETYMNVIGACALEPDLKALPAGDLTEIGEKGINLSGGQKQRVSLARAVYSNSDVYLLDDPLSAVDAHVGRHIFDKVIGNSVGLLKNKTRIFVTHGTTFLPQVDRIILLKDGKICEMGSFDELLAVNGKFAEFYNHHAGEFGKENKAKLNKTEEFSQATTEPYVIQPSETEIKNPREETEGQLVEIEKMELGSVKKQVYGYYLRAIGYPMAITALICSVIFQGFQMYSQIWLKNWSNSQTTTKVPNEKKLDEQNNFMVVFGILAAIQCVALVVKNAVVFISMLKASRKLHDSLLARTLRAPMSFFDTTPLGRILNRFSSDVDVLDNLLPNSLQAWLHDLFTILSTMTIITMITPWFLVSMIPLTAVYLFIQRVFLNTSRQLKRMESVAKSPIYSHFSEVLSGTTSIRAYNKEEMFMSNFEKKVDAYNRCFYAVLMGKRWSGVGIEAVGDFCVFLAGLFAVMNRASLDAGSVALSISSAIQITRAVNWLVRMAAEVETSAVSIERIKEFSDMPEEAALEAPEDKLVGTNWPAEGAIRFDSLQCRYREGLDLALNKFSVDIDPKDKIGIVGRTGAGKTSLTNALFRIIESCGGNICIDSMNISELGLNMLRSRIGIIPQDPMLFSGTLRENLDPFSRYSDSHIWSTLDAVHLKRYVDCNAEGLGYEICEGGLNLSSGQRQLVCLARSLLQRPKILIMDEATSCIDLETDSLIQETIKREFQGSTVLTIAHRISTVMDSTRILVLDKGRVKEYDTPANLISNKDSLFHKLAVEAGCLQITK